MKKEIHPEYRTVLFHDVSVDKYYLIPSTLETDQTKEWEDGNTYPYCPLDVSSISTVPGFISSPKNFLGIVIIDALPLSCLEVN